MKNGPDDFSLPLNRDKSTLLAGNNAVLSKQEKEKEKRIGKVKEEILCVDINSASCFWARYVSMSYASFISMHIIIRPTNTKPRTKSSESRSSRRYQCVSNIGGWRRDVLRPHWRDNLAGADFNVRLLIMVTDWPSVLPSAPRQPGATYHRDGFLASNRNTCWASMRHRNDSSLTYRHRPTRLNSTGQFSDHSKSVVVVTKLTSWVDMQFW